MKRIVYFLVDVNSAYLSWEAAFRIQQGGLVDYRQVPSIVGGNPKTRHGIVLAKSIPAKKLGIKTGETLYSALCKCPQLKIIQPNYTLYMQASNAMVKILKEYTPDIQRFSIDECFIKCYESQWINGSPEDLAYEIKDRIKRELGFTVNIGISTNKLLAKMASNLKKPDQVHTLYLNEIKEKMWPLPIEKLFMVGKASEKKLKSIGVFTIGQLANLECEVIQGRLKSHGKLIWQYANGVETSEITLAFKNKCKSIGNSTTIPYDITTKKEAHLYLLALSEMVSMRLRNQQLIAKGIAVSLKSSEFQRWRHQKKLSYQTQLTNDLYEESKKILDAMWDGEAIRHIGIKAIYLCPLKSQQLSLWDNKHLKELELLDQTIDDLRRKYGKNIIKRGSFLHTGVPHMVGGIEEDYPVMTSLL